jgi:hypothetical protein
MLVKTSAVTIVLLALHAGAVLKEHHAEGPITIAVLEGAISFKALDEERVLRRGGLLALGHAIQHEVEALEESSFVLTVNLRKMADQWMFAQSVGSKGSGMAEVEILSPWWRRQFWTKVSTHSNNFTDKLGCLVSQ